MRMSNQDVINFLNQVRKMLLDDKSWLESTIQPINEAFDKAISALQAQEAKHSNESSLTQKGLDTISRQAAIDIFDDYNVSVENGELEAYSRDRKRLCDLPSAQPTLYGYSVEHLILIASVLQKENLPPERITEALTDIGRVVAIVRDEFVDNLRKAVEKLPSARPEPQWIPVSEGLPEDCTEVFVYLFESPSPYIAWVEDTRWNTEDFEVNREDEPIAWMPLPKPYRAERRTE